MPILKAQMKSGQLEKYPALVTETRNFGFFVDVPGLAMSEAGAFVLDRGCTYIFEPARSHLIGRRTRRIIKLGDKVVVQVFKVDSFKKQVDFKLVASTPARPPGGNPRKREPNRERRR